MPLLPIRVWLDAAAAIADESHLNLAFNTALRSICEAIIAHGMLLQRSTNGWLRVASRVTESRAAAWRPGISAVGDHTGPVLRIEAGHESGTAVMLTTAGAPALMLVLDGEWIASRESLAGVQALGFALAAVREREEAAHIRQLLGRVYRGTRRLTPALGIDVMADRIVKAVVDTLGASRVSLAMIDAANRVTIAAVHGVPQSLRKEMIPAERGVIDRVLRSRRPLLVVDGDDGASARERYQTTSYVAVPILVGGEAIGVLCATDKYDGSLFDDRDAATLRVFAASVAGALLAARTTAERDRIVHAAAIDPLTKLFNRQHFDSRLQQELERTKRENTTAALLIADIDDFKQINDTAGHQGGDRVLECLGEIIRSAVRAIDVSARYGGDEFIVLMPNTDVQSAHACAKRIKSLTAEHCGFSTVGRQATISVGVAVSAPGDDATALFARADKALYSAKAAGKDRISIDATSPAASPAHRGLSYVLIADPHAERLAHYREWTAPFQTGLLVARSGAEAISIMEQFGRPIMLIVDLTAPAMAGDKLIARVTGEATRVLAWSDAGQGPIADGTDGAVHLPADASMVAARDAAQQLLQGHPAVESPGHGQQASGIEVDSLAEQIRGLAGPASIAIYLPTADGQHFRAASTWYAAPPPSTSIYDLRGIFARVRELRTVVTSGAVTFTSDDTTNAATSSASPGLVAIPVIRSGNIRAVVCIYQSSGLVLQTGAIDAMTAIAMPASARFATEDTPEQPVAPRAEDTPVPRSDDETTEGPLMLLDRKPGEAVAARELARARREQKQLSIVLFELAQRSPSGAVPASDDSFEPVVDTFLKAVRQSDLPIRWGANELLLILPGLTGAEARYVAERVRAAMQAGSRHAVAVAGGVAEADPAVRQFDEVVKRARARVAMAVDRGHNRVH